MSRKKAVPDTNVVIPNQVFIGCPWKTVRQKYEQLIDKFKKTYPLSFVIVGRANDQKAEDLLQIIKDKLFNSSRAIFDATGGNANVSLEYGMAEVKPVPSSIYISQHQKAKDSKSDAAIISDIAGKRRNEYKQLVGLRKLLSQFAREHPYTKRFETFLKKKCRRLEKGEKKTFRTLALKIIHYLDEKDSVRRPDVVEELKGQGYTAKKVEDCIKKLHTSNLIKCTVGRDSTVSIG